MSCIADEHLWINVVLDDSRSRPDLVLPGACAQVAIAEFMVTDLMTMLGKHRTGQGDVLWADISEDVSTRSNDIIAWAASLVGCLGTDEEHLLALRFRLDPGTTAVIFGQVVFKMNHVKP